ncbi:hypothetical protein FN846DRAFT_934242 [Sphaerosporella brunnea]|uniref:Guanine nucleotide-exchange factor SEC12 n=1 Tax=Sphaerosporella brunnea TaxID=1250544 RepID=A0A5J5F5I3_9PEZI|nr:hypothetical protein FN846DRAFT_934242 [Sphaerosporella brunnea]
MPATTSEKITLTYPLYSADFLDGDRLVVGGGGGEGRSGVGNKITLLDVSKSTSSQSATSTNIVQLAEHDLGTSEDSCMSMAVARPSPSNNKKSKPSTPTLLAGVNSAESQQREGKNEHFRVFSIASDSITAKTKKQLFTSYKTVDVYQRVLRSRGSLAATATGGGKSNFELLVVSTTDYTVKRRIATESEVADLDLADDGTLAYCTAKEIFITPATATSSAPNRLNFQPTPPIPGAFRSLRFLGNNRIIAVMNAPARSGAELLLLDATTGSIVTRKKLHSGIKAATGLDVADLFSGSGAIAVSGADQSLEILSVENHDSPRIKRAQLFRGVHPFQISKVVFSPPPPVAPPSAASADVEENEEAPKGIRVATTSVGNSIVVHTLPLVASGDGYALLRSGAVARQTAISVLLSLVAVMVFAVLMQVVFVKRGGLSGLQGLVPPIPSGLSEAARGLERDVDALISGLKSGAATDPFDGGAVVEENSVREELLKTVGVKQEQEKEEL